MRVLVVEDEVRLVETVRRGLAAEGFNVEVVSDGEDGLWAATETPTTWSSSTSCSRGSAGTRSSSSCGSAAPGRLS